MFSFGGAGLAGGGGVTTATGVISAGLLTAATLWEQAARENNPAAAIPVTIKFACFIGLSSINAFDGETGNPV
jgi:hypothetical protein